MRDDFYNSVKRGIKNDVKETGVSLFLVGGLVILVVVMLSLIITAAKNHKWSDSTRATVILINVVIGLLMIGSNKIRTLIVQIWLITLVAIPAVIVLGAIGMIFYDLFSKPL
jgi:hypothetical protein